MNKKGFTLVEILAVIVILALLMVVVGTKGFGAFDNSKKKIDELNEKAIAESAKLLKIDIEYCDDDLDKDLVENLIGVNKKCSDLNAAISSTNGITISLDKLIEQGYIEGTAVKEIENEELVTITYKKEDNKITTELNSATKLAQLSDDFLTNLLTDLDMGSTEIGIIKFVDYVDADASKIDVNTTEDSNMKVYAWLDVSTLYIGSETKIYAPESCKNLFNYFLNMKKIDFTNFDTSKVTNMEGMFYQCKNLKEINFGSSFNTSIVENMSNMFYMCSSLTTLNLNNFNTSKVENMDSMFEKCSSLTTLKLDNFDTSSVNNMWDMFNGLEALETLDLRNFNTTSVTDMTCMFCYSNITNYRLDNFDTSNVNKIDFIFYDTSNDKTVCIDSTKGSKIASLLNSSQLNCS